jgi:hypothetical protein
MNVEALAIIGGGALVLLLLIVPLVLWLRRRSGSNKTDGPAVSKFGLLLFGLQVGLMLAAAITAKFWSGVGGAGIFLLSFVTPWGLSEFFKRRGYRLVVSQANPPLERP